MNVDRTPRNPNLLVWHSNTWLIDHGAALYVHHAAGDFLTRAAAPFPQIADHILLPYAESIRDVSARMAELLPRSTIGRIVSGIPDEWIDASQIGDPDQVRGRYAGFLWQRLMHRAVFEGEAERARTRPV